MTAVGGVPRRLPSWSELAPLVRLQPFERDAVERRLRRAQDVADLRLIARRRRPSAVFDDVDGAAEDEVSLRRAKEAFARVHSPSILRDVSAVDTSTTVLGQPARLPLVLAPTGFTRMMVRSGAMCATG